MSDFTIPEPQKIKQTSVKVRRAIQEMEIAGLELQEAIDRLEEDNRQQRLTRLKSAIINA
ncbi:hypothetical protein Cri9333_0428 [Crinalium epipsammum PCC 9333]|uniref:Uncharacterized protein n=1 Tax=Crinalium epipsammum PCC 9333 TaxID=1173022 RepID=K9VV13_9CYAN|nr:hypothetical protein [Crinalium epipsammum]AFZ11399.1 hypothetical protein Cri9333_0428 [Crinalium epipsammum PCC 9333]